MDKFLVFLRQITPISNADYDQAIPLFKSENLNKGDFFVKQDSVCRRIAFIVSGTLRAYYINEKGEEITSCFCTAGHLSTSYKSFILQQTSTLSLEAIESTELLAINYDDLQELYSENPVWQTVGRAIAEREYIVMEQYASILNNESAKVKYLRLLEEQPNVIQKASVAAIASYLGVTRRTLSRIRQEISMK